MWEGRFKKQSSDLLTKFSESVSFDARLYKYDIAGSKAHALALQKKGIISPQELQKITKGLTQIEQEIEEGTFVFDEKLEDIHMNIEAALSKKIGKTGEKLHTARSRNDQIALDLRLFCLNEIKILIKLLKKFQSTLLDLAKRVGKTPIPGYTHLQRAQPVYFAHHFLAYLEMFERDVQRFTQMSKRIKVMPLGSCALAGSTINLNRELIAKQLGFKKISQNSLDAVSDRDFVAEMLFAISLCGIHLSRLSEDIILWNSTEFAFIELSDDCTTGSSLMPQKKNPDIAELTRGKSGRLVGNLLSLLMNLKALPMAYNRDLQEDKEPLFDSCDNLEKILKIFTQMLQNLKILRKNCQKATSDEFLLATDIADYLVLKGMPFREAHLIVGKLTAHCIKQKCK